MPSDNRGPFTYLSHLPRFGRLLGLSAVSLAALTACADQKPKQETPMVDVSLAQYVLDEVPSDLPNPTFIDFEGKVHLVGWSIEPKEKVGPGQKFTLKLYWKSVSRLGSGWRLFTHLVAPGGQRLANPDDVGPLRQALQPSDWQPGKIYVDTQDLEMPRQLFVPSVSITVGLWRQGGMRLDVISGQVDNERRAIVTHVNTGVTLPRPDTSKPAPGDVGRNVAPANPALMQRPAAPQPADRPMAPQPGGAAPQPGGAAPQPGGAAPARAPGDPHFGHDHP